MSKQSKLFVQYLEKKTGHSVQFQDTATAVVTTLISGTLTLLTQSWRVAAIGVGILSIIAIRRILSNYIGVVASYSYVENGLVFGAFPCIAIYMENLAWLIIGVVVLIAKIWWDNLILDHYGRILETKGEAYLDDYMLHSTPWQRIKPDFKETDTESK